MNLVLWIIYAVITLAAIVFLGLREFHMLQLNGYKTPEHSRWMKKNKKRYILPAVLFCAQFALLAFRPMTEGFGVLYIRNKKNMAITAIIIGVLAFMNVRVEFYSIKISLCIIVFTL